METLAKFQGLSTLNKNNDNANKSKFEDTPQEILYLILTWVTGTDIENISKCSRTLQSIIRDEYLWSVMSKTRFPRLYEEAILEINDQDDNNNVFQKNPISWRDIYMSKDDSQLSAAQHMVIIHNTLPYWEIISTTESIYGAKAKLNSVCWFDVRGIMEGVPQGKYRIQWRMRLSRLATRDETFQFKASIVPKTKPLLSLPLVERNEQELYSKEYAIELLSYTTPSGFYYRGDVVNNRWILLTIPGEIEIKDAFSDIRVTHEGHTNYWKSGIELDWVRLQPSSEVLDEGLLVEDVDIRPRNHGADSLSSSPSSHE
ncbi:hypothetical protein INT45_011115 [Circinella minor]|uniref:F-box domain-containing protein n=1 Tax=Circinella minor TaxID=1195481 RepID=A0A8H7VTL3_9FUNG|nr:hypothetical protein INT45_011115 [Circinella minor]